METVRTLDWAFGEIEGTRPRFGTVPRPLSWEASRSLALLGQLIGGVRPPLSGPELHRLAMALLSDLPLPDEELLSRLRDRGLGLSLPPGGMDRARRKADAAIDRGLWIATFASAPVFGNETFECPQFLWGRGILPGNGPRAAFFNSRKSRSLPPQTPWVRFLRESLHRLAGSDLGLAASVGTLTHDLVAAFAVSRNVPLLLVLPLAADGPADPGGVGLPRQGLSPRVTLSCLPHTRLCPGAVRMQCRDRLLGLLADVHVLLEIRGGGTLERTLENQQRRDPRPQLVMLPTPPGSHNEGNARFLREFPGWSVPVRPGSPAKGTPCSRSSRAREPSSRQPRGSGLVDWSRYLYHYTRSCPGPWPGQSSADYLLSILEDDPLCGHTALDTLLRILAEGRIRSSSRLIRGKDPVVSWTPIPPGQLESVRRWNPALIRWTFEPYGIAVSRRRLRRAGAVPTLYGPEEMIARLPEAQRWRFQLHAPPRRQWKQEKEWRLRGDLDLTGLSPEEFFVFVTREEEAGRIREVADRSSRVVVPDPEGNPGLPLTTLPKPGSA